MLQQCAVYLIICSLVYVSLLYTLVLVLLVFLLCVLQLHFVNFMMRAITAVPHM
jgi:hypothetical protein